MKTYYCDLGWRGGVVVAAENEQRALELFKTSYHYQFEENLVPIELKPGEVYDFLGDS